MPVEIQSSGPLIDLKPVFISNEVIEMYRKGPHPLFLVSAGVSRLIPRGKGVIPRSIGRSLAKNVKSHIFTDREFVMAVAPRHLDFYCAVLRLGGWNDEIVEACSAVISDGDTVYDIGANAGYISLAIAKLFAKSEIISFEPQRELAEALVISSGLNGFGGIKTFQCLLGNEVGKKDLHLSSHGIHASTISHQKIERTEKISMYRIDDLVEGGVIKPPRVIKIDVEGAEDQVFLGARAVIAKHTPKIIFEAYPGGQAKRCALLRSIAPYLFFGLRVGDGRFQQISGENEDDRFTDILAATPQDAPTSALVD